MPKPSALPATVAPPCAGLSPSLKAAAVAVALCYVLVPLAAHANQAAGAGIDIDAAVARLSEGAPDLSFVLLVRLLEQRGYRIEQVSPTLLGRVRIVAVNRFHRRELVISRSSGQVLRDALITVFIDEPALADPPPLPPDYFLFPRIGAYPEVPK